MAKDHATLQKEVKELFEKNGWYVIENKKGKSSRQYNSGNKPRQATTFSYSLCIPKDLVSSRKAASKYTRRYYNLIELPRSL